MNTDKSSVKLTGNLYSVTAGSGGYLRIEDAEELRLQEFTYEMFFKWNQPNEIGSVWKMLAGKSIARGKDSWALMFQNGIDGDKAGLVMRFAVQADNADGYSDVWHGNFVVNQKTAEAPYYIFDGKWHHIAVTFSKGDGSATPKHTVKVYVDYVDTGFSRTVTGDLYYNDSPFNIGDVFHAENPTRSAISNVRISKRVLDPKEFLGFRDAQADADTFLWLRFADNDFFGIGKNQWGTLAHYNFCHQDENGSGWLMPNLRTKENGWTVPELIAESGFAAVTRTGVADDAGRPNRGYLQMKGNGAIGVEDKALTVIAGDFTAECVFKADADKDYEFVPLIRQRNSKNVAFNLGFSGIANKNKLTAAICSAFGQSVAVSDRAYNDGQWHHAALVYYREGTWAELWVDHELEKRWRTSIVPYSDTTEVAYYTVGVGGAVEIEQRYHFKGLIDEARVTRRALTREEFITSRYVAKPDVDTVGTVLGHWRYEDGSFISSVGEGWTDARPLLRTNLPTASTDVKGTCLCDWGNPLQKLADNASSLSFVSAEGGLNYPRMSLLAQDNFTVEFYVKPSREIGWNNDLFLPVIRYVKNLDGIWNETEGSIYWSVSLRNCRLYFRMDTPGNNNECWYLGAAGQDELADGKWHHVAITFEQGADFTDSTKTVTYATGYIDGEAVRAFGDYYGKAKVRADGAAMSGGTPLTYPTPGNLIVGYNPQQNFVFDGLIDEVRISAGVLSVDKFLKLRNGADLVIIMR